VAANPAESLLLERLAAGEMPPSGALPKHQVEALRAWVTAGAPYATEPLTIPRAGGDWWSLRPIRRPDPPEPPPGSTWPQNPIDTFILATLNQNGLTPSPTADRGTLIRRVTFDLIGLPPTPEEVRDFITDTRPNAYAILVDRLLASPHYGQRWGRHWLDIVRFGESQGYETNLPRPSAWPYRDYVIQAFNQDTPFPRFVLEQLSADTLETASNEPSHWLTQAATGFLVAGTHDIVGNQTLEGSLQQRADDLDDMITATGTTFLGLTLQCARCHDHKFDPISQRDYYAIQAILAGVNHSERTVDAPNSAQNRREAAAITAELARIDEQLDASEPIADPAAKLPHRAPVSPRRNVDRFTPTKARMLRMTIQATSDNSEPCIDELEIHAESRGDQPARNVALASAGGIASASSEFPESAIHKIAHLNDGQHGNSHSWLSRTPGAGTITITWPQAETIDRVVWGRDRDQRFRDRLATRYTIETALEAGKWQLVASSADRQPTNTPASASTDDTSSARAALLARQSSLRNRLNQLPLTTQIYSGTFSQPGATHLLIRGDPTRKGPDVTPATLAVIQPRTILDAQSAESDRRAALARWIANPANPLPARVMVNRLWHYHFGRGLVATPSDFGYNGTPPSHPELLDWLATTYIDNGWRSKPLHRLIVLSATYQQSSQLKPSAQALDRDNRLLWRVTPRRLEAESIRDAILAVSGQLDTRMGGPGYNIWEPNSNYVAVYKPRAELGPDTFRRMVYQFKPRSQPDPIFTAFDCPDGSLVAPRRNISTTALQALNLLNSRFLVTQSTLFADRLMTQAGPDTAARVKLAFELAFSRDPTSSERSAAVCLIQSHNDAAFCRALFNANEFIYVP
jgi:hypothetical protein